MHWIDLAGALAAHRHSRHYVVTASVDHMDFLVPVRVGDLIILRSSVNRVFHTSMEVGVKVWVENYIANRVEARKLGLSRLLSRWTRKGRHIQVPAVIPETDRKKRRYEYAARRREIRRAHLQRRANHPLEHFKDNPGNESPAILPKCALCIPHGDASNTGM